MLSHLRGNLILACTALCMHNKMQNTQNKIFLKCLCQVLYNTLTTWNKLCTTNLSEHKVQSTLLPCKHAGTQITGIVNNGQNCFQNISGILVTNGTQPDVVLHDLMNFEPFGITIPPQYPPDPSPELFQ